MAESYRKLLTRILSQLDKHKIWICYRNVLEFINYNKTHFIKNLKLFTFIAFPQNAFYKKIETIYFHSFSWLNHASWVDTLSAISTEACPPLSAMVKQIHLA